MSQYAGTLRRFNDTKKYGFPAPKAPHRLRAFPLPPILRPQVVPEAQPRPVRCLAEQKGPTADRPAAHESPPTVRPATPDDIPACAALSLAVHGFHRSPELPFAIRAAHARVAERAGRINAYTTALASSATLTAETLTDLQALIASADTFLGPGILVPTRHAELFRWCLSQGLHIPQPMTPCRRVGVFPP